MSQPGWTHGQGRSGLCPADLGFLQRGRLLLLGLVAAWGGELPGAGGWTEGTGYWTQPSPTALNPAGEASSRGSPGAQGTPWVDRPDAAEGRG